jgi:hypothetical protein
MNGTEGRSFSDLRTMKKARVYWAFLDFEVLQGVAISQCFALNAK